ncbi:hypothetical protein VTJ83DRAFT_4175 [Remersonia thermophila]|uniref:Kelch repeat-containing protein n=1 Tax=Remersonia thermophila TaxID=72144 RepID=A0ABR4D981_9PEZI
MRRSVRLSSCSPRPSMLGPALALLAASAVLVGGEPDWLPGQVNTRICQWQQLRAAVLRDTVYLDGGNLWWQPGFSDGSVREPRNDNNRLGLIYTLNFSTPFNTTQNISAILGTLSTGGGDTNNRAPNYEDGALLHNDHQFFLYGGLLQRTASAADPPGDSVLCYEKHQYGPPRSFAEGFINKPLGDKVTRYVAYGGAANAPSENMAWYFAGLRSATAGPIYTRAGATNRTAAVHVSNYLIELDMADQRRETFANHTLPPDIQGRANPELVWVPVGKRGILVALGGVVYPDFVTITGDSSNPEANKAESPEFIQAIDIYDVDGRKWHRQNTTGGPGQLTRGCAVLARAEDSSSFNIYYYGGYDGLSQKREPFSDDVWVLSLPSFTWVKLAAGTPAEGRAGHKCVTPYPDQMLVIGGYPQPIGAVPACLRETIRVFNLSTGRWLDRYDPAAWAPYAVPAAVVDKIGGSGAGGATAAAPSPSWASDELAALFAERYPTERIATYYPYAPASPTDGSDPSVSTTEVAESGGGVPAYLPPVLGSVLGLAFLTMVGVIVVLYRRRRILRGAASEAGTEDTTGRRINAWLRGQASDAKAPTVTTSDGSAGPYSPLTRPTDLESHVADPPRPIAEMMDTAIQPPAELADTSVPPPPAELHSASTISPAMSQAPSVHHPLYYHAGNAYYSSSLTPPHPRAPPHDAAAASSISTSPVSPTTTGSPVGGPAAATATTTTTTTTTTGAAMQRVLSGVSNLSERDRAHLRQISDATVSSVTTGLGVGPYGQRLSTGPAAVAELGGPREDDGDDEAGEAGQGDRRGRSSPAAPTRGRGSPLPGQGRGAQGWPLRGIRRRGGACFRRISMVRGRAATVERAGDGEGFSQGAMGQADTRRGEREGGGASACEGRTGHDDFSTRPRQRAGFRGG